MRMNSTKSTYNMTLNQHNQEHLKNDANLAQARK